MRLFEIKKGTLVKSIPHINHKPIRNELVM